MYGGCGEGMPADLSAQAGVARALDYTPVVRWIRNHPNLAWMADGFEETYIKRRWYFNP